MLDSKVKNYLTGVMQTIASTAFKPTAETIQVFGDFRRNSQAAYQALWPNHQVRADSITDDEGNVCGYVATVADDEGTPIADRDAFALAASLVMEKKYPDKKFGNGEIIPIDSSADGVSTLEDGTQIYRMAQYDTVGSMAVISDYSRGGPAIDVRFQRAAITAKMIGAQINLSVMEMLTTVRTAGRSLADYKYMGLRNAYVNYLDAGAVFGDPRAGLDGLMTITGKTEYLSPAPIALGMNADQLLTILSEMASAVTIATNTVENSKIFVTPFRVLNVALNTRRTNSSETVYEEFLRSQRMAGLIEDWVSSESLRRVDGGNDVAFMLPKDKAKLCLKCPTGLLFLDGQRIGFGVTIHAMATTLLLVTPAPACILIIRGI
jgi:hypothetical protein